jgi:transcriptional regulator with XRE-family HTH domain
MTKVGRWLKRHRVRNGRTLRDIESFSGGQISNGYLCQVESGHTPEPTPTKLRVICEALGADYIECLFEAGYLTKKDLGRRRLVRE